MGQGAEPGKGSCHRFGGARTRVIGGEKGQWRKLTRRAERGPEEQRQPGPRGWDVHQGTALGTWKRLLSRGRSQSIVFTL